MRSFSKKIGVEIAGVEAPIGDGTDRPLVRREPRRALLDHLHGLAFAPFVEQQLATRDAQISLRQPVGLLHCGLEVGVHAPIAVTEVQGTGEP